VLLDTCVLSELQRPQGSAAVRARVEELDADHLYLSVITFGELVKGITLLSPGARRRELERWLLGLEQHYSEHLLGIDSEVSRLWGEITARAQRNGIIIPATDGLIAATALRHGLHVMTRNTRHFAATGVPIIDPWDES
jgi:predicted nucleic acid-binding protein